MNTLQQVLRETGTDTVPMAVAERSIALEEPTEGRPAAVAGLDWRVTDAILAIARRWPGYLRLAWGLVRDSRVPLRARQWLAAAGAYNLSPIDPIPGIIPVLGQLDDYAILVLAIRKALRASPEAVAQEHLARIGLTAAEIDADLKEMRRIAGHVTRSAAWGVWAGLQFAAGVGTELGRQLAVGVARRLSPDFGRPGRVRSEETVVPVGDKTENGPLGVTDTEDRSPDFSGKEEAASQSRNYR